MNDVHPIRSCVPYAEYCALPALRISLLKMIGKSPKHYQWALTHQETSKALTLGDAAHTATLEPERFGRDYAIWSKRTAAGKMSPRSGGAWETFHAASAGRAILTEDEASDALTIAAAVRSDPVARRYIETGDPEVTMRWDIDGRPCKARIDWMTHIDDEPVLVGLKTAREVRHFAFGAAAARYGYHLQWAWYHDGYVTAMHKTPRMIEIVVESVPPHAVVVYAITEDILAQGRDDYRQHLETLARCERLNEWPGPAETEQVLTLPSWAYGTTDDVSDLGLE